MKELFNQFEYAINKLVALVLVIIGAIFCIINIPGYGWGSFFALVSSCVVTGTNIAIIQIDYDDFTITPESCFVIQMVTLIAMVILTIVF